MKRVEGGMAFSSLAKASSRRPSAVKILGNPIGDDVLALRHIVERARHLDGIACLSGVLFQRQRRRRPGAGSWNSSTAKVRNRHTRTANARAVAQFCSWCVLRGVRFEQLQPMIVAAYIEGHSAAAPTVKQHTAIRRVDAG